MKRLLSVAAGAAVCLSCNASLVAHWTGDNTAVDATPNGHDGTLTGNTAYTTGVLGGAFLFDGVNGSAVNITADTDLEPATFSISLWVQAELENHLRILADSTHGAGNAGWALQINAANNASFAFGNGSAFPEAIAAVNIADGEFHHIAATLDGTNIRLYVDGTLGSTVAYAGTPAPSGRDIRLGHQPALHRPLLGALDEVRLYDHVLGQAEITALASVPEPTSACFLSLAAVSLLRRRR